MVNLISKKQLAGIYILIIGSAILLKIIFPVLRFYFFILIFILVISIQLIISALLKEKRQKLIIPGITLFFSSMFFLLFLIYYILVDYENIISIYEFWPILGVFPAISLVVYYIISKTKSPGTIIPGIFIGLISIILFLNNIKILHLNFSRFLIIIIALMLILIGLYLLFQKKIDNIKKNIENK